MLKSSADCWELAVPSRNKNGSRETTGSWLVETSSDGGRTWVVAAGGAGEKWSVGV